jgi:hypothetical protein
MHRPCPALASGNYKPETAKAARLACKAPAGIVLDPYFFVYASAIGRTGVTIRPVAAK